MRPMRRKDREITDPGKINEIMNRCQVCRLGLRDGDRVYVVPVNFGLAEREGKQFLYFHGAKEGRKADLIRQTGYACFEMDTGYRLQGGEQACDYTAAFQSIIGEGTIAAVEDPAEKERGLNAVMRQSTGKDQWTYGPAMLEAVGVFRLEVETLTCKEHL